VTDWNEQITIEKIIAGDTHAFAKLVDRYKDMTVLLAYNILLNQEDAEEVAQDAFVKAFTALHTYKAEARFSTWLYRIVVNTALNRKKLKKYPSTEIVEETLDDNEFQASNIEAWQVTAEHRKHIQAALQSLNVNERLCITLYYLNELSVEEIRSLTGISNSNIKVLLHRGRKNLYKALHKQLKNEITNLIRP
jgi:RNA polymerase sigma-70 factor (ECF subfamily)